jgi:hypothetical protein
VVLERRYRRLLRWYPASYRAVNAEEMLGVALAGAAPGRRRPSAGETASLVLGGLRERSRALPATARSEAWPAAAAVFTLLGAVLQAAIFAEEISGAVASAWSGTHQQVSMGHVAGAAVWSVAVLAALLRWRWVTVAAVCLGAAGEAVHFGVLYPGNPAALVTAWWLVTLAVMTALAAVAAAVRPGTGRRPRWLIAVGLLSAAAATAFPVVEAGFSSVTAFPGGGESVSNPLSGIEGPLRYGLAAAIAISAAGIVVRQVPAVRRRIILLALPALSAAALTAWAFGGFLASTMQFGPPARLTAVQWAALGTAPALAFAAGLTLIARHERTLRRAWQAGAAGEDGPSAS